jgi:CRISPR/Cas system-associated exonuclease Cas4 (RecB family)
MPITLYHGPPSQQKLTKLREIISELQGQHKDFVLLVGQQSDINWHKQFLLTQTGHPVVLGEAILTWQDFLLKLLKANHYRVHLADTELGYFLLYLLINTKHQHFLNGHKDLFLQIKELYHFFKQIKTCGVNIDLAKTVFPSNADQILNLFTDFQKEMQAQHYYDSGDLHATVIQALSKQLLKFFGKKITLILHGIYPLQAGQRQVLRLLRSNFPEVDIHLFYDQDFKQSHQSLEQAYLDLGDISDHSEYIAGGKLSANKITALNPYIELEQIKKLIQKNTKQNTAIALSSTDYTELLSKKIHLNQVEHSIGAPLNFNYELLQGKELSKKDNLQSWLKYPDFYSQQKIRLINQTQDLNHQLEFLCTHFSHLAQKLLPDQIQDYAIKRAKEQSLKPNGFHEQTILTSLSQIGHIRGRLLVLPGFCLENIASKETSYDSYLYENKAFHELLESPQYRYSIAIEQIKQAIAYAKQTIILEPRFNFKDKPTTRLNIDIDYIPLEGFELQGRSNKGLSLGEKDYFKTKRKTFSVTELQEYLNCPYRYYASYHLKLKKPEEEELEPAANIKGSFVHRILQRLIQENETDYLEGLEYESFRQKIKQKLAFIIQDELTKNEDFKKYDAKLIEFYSYRVYKTIIHLIDEEGTLFRENKKRTTPKHFEWAFGRNKTDTLSISTKNGPIFLRGRIDRIDVNNTHKNFAVIDYKTGNPPSLSDLKKAKEIQIPLYVLAVQKLLYPDFSPAGGYFYALKENVIKGFSVKQTSDQNLMHSRSQISEREWQELIDLTVNQVRKIVENIYAANYEPNPIEESQCRFCDYRRICGHESN